MVYKHYRTGIAVRVVLLALSLLLLAYLVIHTHYYVSIVFLLLCCVLQATGLIRYTDRTNERLARFFSAIRYDDFTQMFGQNGSDRSFALLNRELNEVIASFRSVRKESEEQRLFLKNVIQHIGIGLLVFDKDGKVEQCNTTFKRLLRLPALHHIDEIVEPFGEVRQAVRQLKNGEGLLLKVIDAGELLQLSVSLTEFMLREQRLRLVTMQNIGRELNEKELEAWHNLTRVLAHEIMNSMTPIISLASSAAEALKQVKPTGEEQGVVVKDVARAIDTIERRSEGLLRFVESYRSIARIPRPEFRLVPVRELLESVRQLMAERLSHAGVRLKIAIDLPDMQLTADRALVEQVLINLLLNAIDALENVPQPVISIHAFYDEKSRVCIDVEDNGKGIAGEVREKIFIPFFSTKRQGSGIGLSLTKQIMWLHSGTIHVESEPGNHTVFRLRF